MLGFVTQPFSSLHLGREETRKNIKEIVQVIFSLNQLHLYICKKSSLKNKTKQNLNSLTVLQYKQVQIPSPSKARKGFRPNWKNWKSTVMYF